SREDIRRSPACRRRSRRLIRRRLSCSCGRRRRGRRTATCSSSPASAWTARGKHWRYSARWWDRGRLAVQKDPVQCSMRCIRGGAAANIPQLDESLRDFDAPCNRSPPLRPRGHLESCLAGLKDGTIDVIASGHTPRASEKKMQDIDLAPFGMVSLETTLSLVIT